MKQLFTIFFILIVGTALFGQNVIQVSAGSNQIWTAYQTASSGDILELVSDGGIYKEDSTLKTTFPLTIRAAEGLSSKPVWETSDRHVIDLGSSLWLSGFKMTGMWSDDTTDWRDSTKYAIVGNDAGVDSAYVLHANGVDFDFFNVYEDGEEQGYVFRPEPPAEYAKEVVFKNCTFTRVASYVLRFRTPTIAPGQFGLLHLENCTAADIGSNFTRNVLLPADGDTAKIRVNHCTFYNIGGDVLRFDDGTDIEVTNSIFINTGDIVDAPDGMVVYCDTMNTAGFNIDNDNAIIENIYAEDPEFADPDTFDFTVSSFFKSIAQGSDDQVVGDLRWDPDYQATDIIQVKSGLNNIQAAYNLAKAGDILELISDGGVYKEESALLTSFPITIRAAGGLATKPVWETSDRHVIDLGSSLWLSGFKMTGMWSDDVTDTRDSTKYAIVGNDNGVDFGYKLHADGVDFDFFNVYEDGEEQGYVFRPEPPAEYAEEVVFRNCTFTRVASYVLRFRTPTVAPGQFGLLHLENCTAADIGSNFTRNVLLPADGDTAKIRVNHCTFYNIGGDVLRFDDGTDIEVTNSIFVNTGDIVDAPDGMVVYCDTMNTAGFNIDNDDAVIENIYAEDPEFLDPDKYDFTVSGFFKGIAVGNDGLVVGDLRWDPDYQGSNVIQVSAGTNNINAAYNLAKAGDILELVTDGGVYKEESALLTSFPITIRAASGLATKPVWETSDRHVIDLGSSLWLSGFKMTGMWSDDVTDARDSTKYAIVANDNGVDFGYKLHADGVDFDFFNVYEDGEEQGYVFRPEPPAEYAEEVVFMNCTFTRVASYVLRFRTPTVAPGQFGLLHLENCTAADIGSNFTRNVLLPADGDTAKIRVNHCTFYNIGGDVLRFDDGNDIEVKNSIFVNTGDIVDAPDGMVVYCDTMNTAGFNIDNDDAVIENIYAEDPEFLDPDKYDFTVSSFFASIAIGDDGKVVGDSRWTDVPHAITNSAEPPIVYDLAQNYPNPFNPTTTINYQIAKSERVKLSVYNILGQEIIRLVDENQKMGKYRVLWNGRNASGNLLSSGIYFFRLEAGDYVHTKKMTFLK
jgi:hypothetical protein